MTSAEHLQKFISPWFPTFICCTLIISDFYQGWIVPGLSAQLAFIGIFYWALSRPDLLSPLAIFLTATIVDLISFKTVGVTGFFALGLFAIIMLQRHYFIKQTFVSNWGLFSLMLFCQNILILCGHFIAQNSFEGAESIMTTTLANFLYTCSLFPILFSGLYKAQTLFIEDEK